MFLKNVKAFIRRSHSMTVTLTLLYGLSTIGLLLFIGVSSTLEIREVLDEKSYQFVTQKINIISEFLLRGHLKNSKLTQEIEETPTLLSLNSTYRYYIRLINLEENKIVETKNMDHIFEKASFFHEKMNDSYEETQDWKSPEGKNYFLTQRRIDFDQNNWLIQVGLDTTYEKSRLSEYEHKLLLLLIGGIVMAILLGFLVTKKGLKQLHNLTQAAQAISCSSLHTRINPRDCPHELQKLVLAFNQMLDRLEESFQRLTQFSSDLAHELRTPVNNLLGEIEVALAKLHSPSEYQDILASNIEEVQRISHIIENILFLARTENPKIDLPKEKLNLKNEIALVAEYYQPMAEEMGISISLEGEGNCQGNSIMFRRMISNLISNSLKYSHKNSLIKIEINQAKGDRVKIVILDEGLGISEEHLKKIFSRFYRVDCSRTQNSGGVGLGLPIVKSIVDVHRGEISISSKLNQGTRVEVLLPRTV